MQLTWSRISKNLLSWASPAMLLGALWLTVPTAHGSECSGIDKFEQNVGGGGGANKACHNFVETLPQVDAQVRSMDSAAQASMAETHNLTVGATDAGAGGQATANAVAGDVAADQRQLQAGATQAKATIERELQNVRLSCERISKTQVRPEQAGLKQEAMADCQRLTNAGEKYRGHLATKEASYRQGGDAALANYIQTKSNFGGFESFGGSDSFPGSKFPEADYSAVKAADPLPETLNTIAHSDTAGTNAAPANFKNNFEPHNFEAARTEGAGNLQGEAVPDHAAGSPRVESAPTRETPPENLRTELAGQNQSGSPAPANLEASVSGHRVDETFEKPNTGPAAPADVNALPSSVPPTSLAKTGESPLATDAEAELHRYDAPSGMDRPEQITLIDDADTSATTAAGPEAASSTASLSARLAQLHENKLRDSIGANLATDLAHQTQSESDTTMLSGASRMGSIVAEESAVMTRESGEGTPKGSEIESSGQDTDSPSETFVATTDAANRNTNALEKPVLNENEISMALGVPDASALTELEVGLGIREPAATASPLSQSLVQRETDQSVKGDIQPPPEFLTEEAESFIDDLAETAIPRETKPPLAMNRTAITRSSVN